MNFLLWYIFFTLPPWENLMMRTILLNVSDSDSPNPSSPLYLPLFLSTLSARLNTHTRAHTHTHEWTHVHIQHLNMWKHTHKKVMNRCFVTVSTQPKHINENPGSWEIYAQCINHLPYMYKEQSSNSRTHTNAELVLYPPSTSTFRSRSSDTVEKMAS